MTLTEISQKTKPENSLKSATRIVLVLEYDGSRYHGFQLQTNLPTIQGKVEQAIQKLTGNFSRVTGASRTDTGVHAKGQVVSFKTESSHSVQTFIKGLNYHLPEDIAVKEAHKVRDSFNVRREAINREYSYHILNSSTRSPLKQGLAHLVPGNFDTDTMNEACQALIGVHDLASFVSRMDSSIKITVRHIYKAEIKRDGQLIIFNIVANAFLPHQVRNTVGSLIKIGLGRISKDEFYSIMKSKKPGMAGPMAPSCGLCLIQVNYPNPFEEEIQ